MGCMQCSSSSSEQASSILAVYILVQHVCVVLAIMSPIIVTQALSSYTPHQSSLSARMLFVCCLFNTGRMLVNKAKPCWRSS
jgi:hypothetical protein